MMKKKWIALLALAAMLTGTCALAQETEAVSGLETEALSGQTAEAGSEETEERNYAPESGTGWLAAKINDNPVELEFTGESKGMTGTIYSFESEDYTVNIMLNKSLKAGEAMEENAVSQIEVLSREKSSVGYYFTKKSSGTDVESTAALAETDREDLVQAEFTVTVPAAERYVGDFKPGILPELVFTEGEFCFCR